MLAQNPKNFWLLELMADIDIAKKCPAQAITRLEAANTAQTNKSCTAT